MNQITSANTATVRPSIVIEPVDLHTLLSVKNDKGPDTEGSKSRAGSVILVDIGNAEQYIEAHIPGALPLEYSAFVRTEGKVGGLLPSLETLESVLQNLAATTDSYLVCYDRQGGSAASRLIWTLHAFNFHNCSLLNGGLNAWIAEGLETATGAANPVSRSTLPAGLTASREVAVNTDEVLQMMHEADHSGDRRKLTFLDARSRKEYDGADVRSARGGHVPGAHWLEWTDALDAGNHKKLLSDEALRKQVSEAGFTADDKIVVYCQTHQRSSLSYVMLRHLGFDNVLGLEGAWSEWGNRDDTPVET